MSTVDIKSLKDQLAREREATKLMRNGIKESLRVQKQIRAALKMERSYTKTVREDAKRLRTEKRAAKRAENIAKLEARLTKMKLKADRKNGPVKVYSAEEIAALNAVA